VKVYVKIIGYISPISWEAPCGRLCMKFRTGGRLQVVINCAIFFCNQLRGFQLYRGVEFLAVCVAPLIQCCTAGCLWYSVYGMYSYCDAVIDIWLQSCRENRNSGVSHVGIGWGKWPNEVLTVRLSVHHHTVFNNALYILVTSLRWLATFWRCLQQDFFLAHVNPNLSAQFTSTCK